MITFSGKAIFPKGHPDHTGEAPDISDIAIGLARHLRFAGQLPHEYSVLCHSFTVFQLVDEQYGAYALLHDAGEAFIGDIPTPLKTEDIRAVELEIVESISESVGISWPWPEEAQRAVKDADLAALAAEAHALGHAQAEKYWPRADFDENAEHALRLTHGHIAEGWTDRFRRDLKAAVSNYGTHLQGSLPGRKAAEALLQGTGARPAASPA